MTKINCFIPAVNTLQVDATLRELRQCPLVGTIFLLAPECLSIEGCRTLALADRFGSEAMRQIAAHADSPYTLIYAKFTPLVLGQNALERLTALADDTRAGMLYADYYQSREGKLSPCPTIDYQIGSIRDDFNFGSLLLFNSDSLKQAVAAMDADYRFAGLYDLRLKIAQRAPIVRLNELLYTEVEQDHRASGERQFDYVDPRNRAVQIEMEQAATAHLRNINAWLPEVTREIVFDSGSFDFEASVIIPVRNRCRTLDDAIRSVLSQQTTFKFNLIIVDNLSTDGTTEIIAQHARADRRIIHLVPDRNDLGIGGCWNLAVDHACCGRFAVQLDSDDLYENENTLQKIVDTFHREGCAMVVGSYTMTDIDLNTIAPGLIDHREWTPANGHNNALRINGLGAPRAFYTPLLRQFHLPNTSYGEDYAIGLRFSRDYRIGRIYDSLYLCRRWDDNSDAALDIHKTNTNNAYKDKLRSLEIMARQTLNERMA